MLLILLANVNCIFLLLENYTLHSNYLNDVVNVRMSFIFYVSLLYGILQIMSYNQNVITITYILFRIIA